MFVGFIIQIISAVNATGYWHPDQHHSIIEFATYKLGITPADLMARELPEQVRQTLQVYVFLGFYKIVQLLHLHDAYTAHTILRLFTSLLNFALFNYIILRTFSKERVTLYALLIVANFSWPFPYIRTLFNSEVYGGLAYFSAILLYQHFRHHSMTLWRGMLVGIVLSLAFFFRFQMDLAMLGLALWLLFLERASFRTLTGIAIGFMIGTAFNVFLDSVFYGELTFTPYTYWKVNVIDGRAMGRFKPIWHYVGVLGSALTAPPLSLILLLFVVRGLYTRLKDPYSLSVTAFLLAHFIVPHKEPRFMFPLTGILPVILGYGLGDLLHRLPDKMKRGRFAICVESLVFVSALVNTVLLALLLFVPVAQHIQFTKVLNEHFDEGTSVEVVCFQRTPYETPTVQNVATYYLHSKKPNIEITKVRSRFEFLDRIRNHKKNTFFVATYDRLVRYDLLDEMSCKRLAVSSRFLFRINRWLQALGGPVLPELWALYQCRTASGP